MNNWQDISNKLKDLLGLQSNPMGIKFSNEKTSFPLYEGSNPSPTKDGRTGKVSAGCVFWMYGSDKAFTTVPDDHFNCSVGTFTHGLKTMEEVKNNEDVAAILDCGWVTPEIVPEIPYVKEKYNFISYGPLNEFQVDPDIVFLRINGKGLMTLKDAFPNLKVEGKPQCHIIPIAKEQEELAISSGCMLSRVRTGMSNSEMTASIPAKKISDIMNRLENTCSINDTVAQYASKDASRFKK